MITQHKHTNTERSERKKIHNSNKQHKQSAVGILWNTTTNEWMNERTEKINRIANEEESKRWENISMTVKQIQTATLNDFNFWSDHHLNRTKGNTAIFFSLRPCIDLPYANRNGKLKIVFFCYKSID